MPGVFGLGTFGQGIFSGAVDPSFLQKQASSTRTISRAASTWFGSIGVIQGVGGMSVSQPITVPDDWFAGEDKILQYTIGQGTPIICTVASLNAATSISVSALKTALSTNDTVTFTNGVTVTLSGNAVVGATSISVNAVSGAIQTGEVGFKVLDITGWSLQWVLRQSPTDTATVLTKSTGGSGITLTSPTTGVCQVSIAAADTTSLTAETYYYTLRRSDAGSSQVLAFGSAVLQQAATR